MFCVVHVQHHPTDRRECVRTSKLTNFPSTENRQTRTESNAKITLGPVDTHTVFHLHCRWRKSKCSTDATNWQINIKQPKTMNCLTNKHDDQTEMRLCQTSSTVHNSMLNGFVWMFIKRRMAQRMLKEIRSAVSVLRAVYHWLVVSVGNVAKRRATQR